MAGPKQEADPSELGMDAGALQRADRVLQRYVDAGRIPGYHLVVARRGRVVHTALGGHRDVDLQLAAQEDTLWRIFSMTKPITSVAAMMLFEEGAFQLTDPISRFLPAFAEPRVYVAGSDLAAATVPATEPIRIWHLLTHTAGLTYGFHRVHPVDAMLRARGFEWGTPPGLNLEAAVDLWAGLPLIFQPGSEWNYSLATDVLGRLVEVASGQSLDTFFRTRITDPLGMTDTSFRVLADDLDRLATLYNPTATGMTASPRPGPEGLSPPMLSGGGGLVSTAADYHRFVQCLARGGELDGVRLLGPRTVDYMTRNHLPGGADLEGYGRRIVGETPQSGVGFGLGFGVVVDPAAIRGVVSFGEYSWGGAASTAFWVDPVEELTVVLMTQLLPSSTYPLRQLLRQTINSALVT
jgi:CubicO group peptidase (beta-lactamase class C family)